MWVVKLGGSLCSDAALPQWLSLLTQLGGGRVAVVCGGGTLADEVRALQGRWAIDDLASHNMAVLAMVQNAYLLHGLAPQLQRVAREADIAPVLRRGEVALWMPLELLRERPDATTNWDVTSDSIALQLAQRWHAERLVIVKCCDVGPGRTLEDLVEDEVLDAAFARTARHAGVPVDLLCRDQPEQLRSLLLTGERHSLAASAGLHPALVGL
ncbi:MAG TPA: aspartate kinase [Burkholderiaceae bacterium]|nr:aspartate kinase [Burkholderiaceae bacterium]HNG82023.1 aspartate kinase [Burkholderiaceae bacterium]